MKIEVNDVPVDPFKVTYRELNHGQKYGFNALRVSISICTLEVARLFSSQYQKFTEEILEDYKTTGDREPHDLHEAGFPSLDNLLQEHLPAFEEVVKDYLFIEFLESILPKDPIEYDYVVNSIESVGAKGGTLIINCEGFRTAT